MALANNYAHLFEEYLSVTPWGEYEDHYDTLEYMPEVLQQLYAGTLDEDEEQEVLGEMLAKLYYQESLSNGIQVVMYPLVLLCMMDKIKNKAFVLEFILEIEQRYLYLKGFVGVLPYRYAYVGEVFEGDIVAAASVQEGELPYYEAVVALRELITSLFEDADPLVQNLAIKIYGLTAYTANGAYTFEKGPLLPQLQKPATAGNTIVTLGLAARLSGGTLEIPEDTAAVASYYGYVQVARALAGGTVNVAFLQQEGEQASQPAHYETLPWFNGDLELLSLAGLAPLTLTDMSVLDYYLDQLRRLKKQPQTIRNFAWKAYEVAAEFLAAPYYADLVPAGHKRNISELSDAQVTLLKKLSAELKIITSLQTVAGLPESIKEVNQFVGLAV